jgi:DNA-binding CsgD family transcriptional regulator/tetratricopeptide (TPR) repeat protein
VNFDLIERAEYLTTLHDKYKDMSAGEGHCIMLSGEAGIGKTALVRAFCQEHRHHAKVYVGTCDALFTPRPLAPVYDVIWQIWEDDWKKESPASAVRGQPGPAEDRSSLFTDFLQRFDQQPGPSLVVFEDIHWADEATIDFIKFLARRITRFRCLFILTWRDEEVPFGHPLKQLLGQLPPHLFTRLQLPPLSRTAVENLAKTRGYRGEDVYGISGGNPFYVNEILASYSPGIPDNIKDTILSVFNRLDITTRQVCELLSVLPTGLETNYLEELEPQYATALASCLETKIILLKDNRLSFKHELYRRTIEYALSPFIRIQLNRRILTTFRERFEAGGETERIIHHAKNANDHPTVVQYAPVAARQAAALGAHVEAARLYHSAIEYYQGKDQDTLVTLYEPYAYECYLTNRMKEAIIYQQKVAAIWQEKGNPERLGDSLWFLSRLWWFDGNRRQAERFARQAVDTLADRPSSRPKAMAFSNMSHLKMLSDQTVECIHWGENAIRMAEELADEEILSHAYNNVGSVQMRVPAYRQKGLDLLKRSLDIALRRHFHEHAARAYTNIASNAIQLKDYQLATSILFEGIHYCEEVELDSWRTYMLSWKARLLLDTGHWTEASAIAEQLIRNETQASIVKILALVVLGTIRMRAGEADALPLLLEARTKAFESMELQRMLPALTALLEYEWITGQAILEKAAIECVIGLLSQGGTLRESSEFDFWLWKVRGQQVPLHAADERYRADHPAITLETAAGWGRLGCPYEQALFLFEGDDEAKRQAIAIVHRLGAGSVYEKMKLGMRSEGIRSIPRGSRKTTRDNPALLTERELGVLELLKEGLQNKEIGSRLYISAKTVDHHISAILFKLDVDSRTKAVREAIRRGIVK